jgi:murein L,D-transpeptidase YcbB/YkuD
MSFLGSADRHAVDADSYQHDALLDRLEQSGPSAARWADLELDLALVYLAAVLDVSEGQTQPGFGHAEWGLDVSSVDLLAVLRQAAEPAPGGLALGHVHPSYSAMQAAYARYRELAAAGGWPEVPAVDPPPTAGEEVDRVWLEALVERLRIEGDLSPAALESLSGIAGLGGLETLGAEPILGDVVLAGVASFQRRHGLAADGVVGRDTLAALNVPAAQRARQLAVNLERLRWSAPPAEGLYLVVNIPEYRLRGYRDGALAASMEVVVGKPSWPTPIFREAMRYIDVNPSWSIPASIAAAEVVPEILSDPTYIDARRLQLVGADQQLIDPLAVDWHSVEAANLPFFLRQPPGPANPLGRIKFMFPNPWNVYLHDTPERAAFTKDRRALSHGCVRVAEPLALAELVLADAPQWSRDALDEVLRSRASTRIVLEREIPVLFTYQTAFVDEEGKVNFREDIYRYDTALTLAVS